MQLQRRRRTLKLSDPQIVQGAGDPGRPAEARLEPPLAAAAGRVGAELLRARRKRERALQPTTPPASRRSCTSWRCSCCRPRSRSAICRVTPRSDRVALSEPDLPVRAARGPGHARPAPGARSPRAAAAPAGAAGRSPSAARAAPAWRPRRTPPWPPSGRRPARAELVRARAPGRSPARPARGRARGRSRAACASSSSSASLEELDHAGRVGEVVLALDQAEGPRAAGEDVQPPVLHALEHLLDLARAADRLELLVGEPHDPELPLGRSELGLQALLDHPAVAVLEDVQRHALAGQRHDPQREQRKAPARWLGHRVEFRCTRGCPPPDWRSRQSRAFE